jgi:RNA polymerase sigma-70 factor (ECF subfamily)
MPCSRRKARVLEGDAALKDYHLLYASIGELERRRGRDDVARAYLNKALALARTDPERRFLANRLDLLC